jgi:DNA polymerase-4
MPVRYLFIDMNAFFASVEQQDRPELRDQPVAVVPTLVETTCCIAASYEAKRWGVQTGVSVREARQLCPELRLVGARPALYVHTHRRILEAIETCLHVDTVHSIDEFACRLLGEEQQPERAILIAQQIKLAIARDVGERLRCSIGLGPNVVLAKVAADMQKPDGLTVIRSEDLPERLHGLQLKDLPGIGRRMERRLHAAGVTTVEHLCRLPVEDLVSIWGSQVLGRMWWQQLRGDDLPGKPTRRRTVSHSHVLPPDLRNEAGAGAVVRSLLYKAAARMRRLSYWARSLTVCVDFLGGSAWHERRRIEVCQDTLTLLRLLLRLWERKPRGIPLRVGVVLADLLHGQSVPRSLFAEDRRLLAVSEVMDQINDLFGPRAIYFANMDSPRVTIPTRIAFTQIPDL